MHTSKNIIKQSKSYWYTIFKHKKYSPNFFSTDVFTKWWAVAIWALQSNSLSIFVLLILKILLFDVEFNDKDDKDDEVDEDDENRFVMTLAELEVVYDADKTFGEMRPDMDELAAHSLTLSKLTKVFLVKSVLGGLLLNETHDIDFCSVVVLRETSGGIWSVACVWDCGSFLYLGGSGGGGGVGKGVVKSSRVIVICLGCKWKSDVL